MAKPIEPAEQQIVGNGRDGNIVSFKQIASLVGNKLIARQSPITNGFRAINVRSLPACRFIEEVVRQPVRNSST